MEPQFTHQPVLLGEVLEALDIKPDGIYLDGTYGRGGHAAAILARLGPQGRLLAIDKDPHAVDAAQRLFAAEPRFAIERGSFADLARCVDVRGWRGRVAGILLDLGVSSPQLDDASRGFSFQNEGPLDMRMDPDSGIGVAQWLASARETEIASVLKDFGEERYAKRIARAIVHARAQEPIATTKQLAEIVARAHPNWEQGKHPATRSFQALRIFINHELDDLRTALRAGLDVLACGGRLAVITFHSLEDRIVKQFMRDAARGDDFPPGLPVTIDQLHPTLRIIGKAVRPNSREIDENPRARSATLRVAEKIA